MKEAWSWENTNYSEVIRMKKEKLGPIAGLFAAVGVAACCLGSPLIAGLGLGAAMVSILFSRTLARKP